MSDKIVMFNEFVWSEGDTVYEFFEKSTVEKLRLTFIHDCLGCAEKVKRILQDSRILARVIMFKNTSSFVNPLQIPNDITGVDEVYTHHAVVLLGNCVIDLLHSDMLFNTNSYFKNIDTLGMLELIKPYNKWFNSEGYEVDINVRCLQEHTF